jgi:hypothetical protein
MPSWVVVGPTGLVIEFALVVRCLQVSLLRKYPFFYVYIFSATLLTVAVIGVELLAPDSYRNWYWPSQFVTLVTGYGILLEILHHVLAPYPGAERLARIGGVVAFGAVFCFALVAPWIIPSRSAGTLIELERDLRSVQAIFISGLLGVIFYYGIPIGKNMKGMILGYGLYIVTSLVSRAVWAYAGDIHNAWNLVQPLSFDLSLVVWLVALWSYHPNPVPDPGIRLEEDYEALVSRMRGRIADLWADLARTLRP